MGSMLKSKLEDPLNGILFSGSWFKPAQLDSALCRIYAKENGMKVKDVLNMRDNIVSFGSFDRSCKQAASVISRSILTLVLAQKLGIIAESGFDQVEQIVSLIERLSQTGNDSLLTQAVKTIEDYVMRVA